MWHRVKWTRKRDGETFEYPYYRCSTNNQQKQVEACKWSARADVVDDWLRAQLRKLTVDEDSLDQAARMLNEQRAHLVAQHESQTRQHRESLSLLRRRLNTLMDKMLDDWIDKDTFFAKKAELEREIAEAESRMAEGGAPRGLPDYADVVQSLRRLPDALAAGDTALRPLLRRLVRRVEVRSKSDFAVFFVVEGL